MQQKFIMMVGISTKPLKNGNKERTYIINGGPTKFAVSWIENGSENEKNITLETSINRKDYTVPLEMNIDDFITNYLGKEKILEFEIDGVKHFARITEQCSGAENYQEGGFRMKTRKLRKKRAFSKKRKSA